MRQMSRVHGSTVHRASLGQNWKKGVRLFTLPKAKNDRGVEGAWSRRICFFAAKINWSVLEETTPEPVLTVAGPQAVLSDLFGVTGFFILETCWRRNAFCVGDSSGEKKAADSFLLVLPRGEKKLNLCQSECKRENPCSTNVVKVWIMAFSHKDRHLCQKWRFSN